MVVYPQKVEFTPMVDFFRSLRMEATAQPPASSETVIDPFDAIDFDELDDTLKANLQKIQAEFVKTQTAATELEGKRAAAENFAREQQARADRLQQQAGPKKESNGGVVTFAAEMEEKLIADGLKPEQAKIYAKMFATSAEAHETRLLQKLGPLIGTVGDLQADTHLQAARRESPDVFGVDEINKAVTEGVQSLVTAGRAVIPETVQHLRDMAVGAYVVKHGKVPSKTPTTEPVNQQSSIRQVRSSTIGGGNGGFVASQNNNGVDPNAPVATQPETASIMANLTKFFPKPSGKGAKK